MKEVGWFRTKKMAVFSDGGFTVSPSPDVSMNSERLGQIVVGATPRELPSHEPREEFLKVVEEQRDAPKGYPDQNASSH